MSALDGVVTGAVSGTAVGKLTSGSRNLLLKAGAGLIAAAGSSSDQVGIGKKTGKDMVRPASKQAKILNLDRFMRKTWITPVIAGIGQGLMAVKRGRFKALTSSLTKMINQNDEK